MERKITVRISGREYCLRASSPENEEVIRKAVSIINQKIQNYQKNFAGKSELDLLTFVALNECISNVKNGMKNETDQEEVRKLSASLEAYLNKER